MEQESANISQKMRRNVGLMLVVGISMWTIVPIGWLFVGSRVKIWTDNLNLALLVTFVGTVATIVLCVRALSKLNDQYYDEYEALNDVPMERSPLEPILVISAVVAIIGFFIWFSAVGGNVTSSFSAG